MRFDLFALLCENELLGVLNCERSFSNFVYEMNFLGFLFLLTIAVVCAVAKNDLKFEKHDKIARRKFALNNSVDLKPVKIMQKPQMRARG